MYFYFSSSYTEARRRIHEAAAKIGASVESYEIDADVPEALAIDVVAWGPEDAPTVLTTTGVHGVEGFLGSAIQLAYLDHEREQKPSPVRQVMIHAVNPFGFSQLRRFNEDNVDLNRNFLDSYDTLPASPKAYGGLDAFLNPASPPARFEFFKLKALGHIWRDGMQPLKQAIAGGQYDFPKGLFYGGASPSQSAQIVFQHCDEWIGAAPRVTHIDFHSGLGRWGGYKLLLAADADQEEYSRVVEVFPADQVEPPDAEQQTAYKVSGLFGGWMKNRFRGRDYRFVAAEFGTHRPLRVLQALRAENRAHHYGDKNSSIYRAAKNELLECFCPEVEGGGAGP